jgi:lysozyme family protein
MIYKYKDFLLENKFNQIIDELFIISENGKWIDDRTYEWDLTKNDNVFTKLKNFLSNLSKDKIKKYFYDFIEKVKVLPNSNKIIARYSAVFLIFVSLTYLTTGTPEGKEPLSPEIKEIVSNVEAKKEVKKEVKKSSFDEAQKFVKLVEGGYTQNKSDDGNFVKTPYGRRLVGTNYGISAPVLYNWLGKLPTKEDMKNLTYEDALKIYKKEYWDRYKINEYQNQSIATLIYDGAVNQGPGAMDKIIKKATLEQSLEIKNFYNINDIKNINELDQEKLFNDIKKYREERYKSSKGRKTYLKGWLNRLNSINYE